MRHFGMAVVALVALVALVATAVCGQEESSAGQGSHMGMDEADQETLRQIQKSLADEKWTKLFSELDVTGADFSPEQSRGPIQEVVQGLREAIRGLVALLNKKQQ